ncbi:ABC transporter permease [Clostridium novyi A str. 4552]|uniref:ABC transporter permease n=1 Tax=Clostridium novyi A str. 4552 TaxID=1444289 RepID=A0A0A0I2K5_CLONO|nr:ABC transporter permease subunit [Clostridium novyi]KGM94556.1 ABC transporter permease [Clostridium novyi A str. 4552]
MIFTLIKNEFIKLMSRKKTYVVIIAFVLLLGFIGFGVYSQAKHIREDSKPENRIAREHEQIKSLNNMKNDPKIPKEDKKEFDREITEAYKRIDEIKEEAKKGKVDWRVTLKKEIKETEEQLKQSKIQEVEKDRLTLDLQQKRYLLNNDIEPKENKFEVRAIDYIEDVMGLLGTIFLVVGVIVFGSDMVSGEYTPPTMKFLLTEPVSRGKILFAKFVTLVVSSTIFILGIELIAFLVMGLIFKFGDLNYPVQVGTKFAYNLAAKPEMGEPLVRAIAGTTFIIPMWKYIINMFLLQALFIIACTAFTFMLSTVLKSSMVSMALSIVLVIVFNIFSSFPALKKVAQFIFTSYGSSPNILNGGIIQGFGNVNLTPTVIVIILAVWTVVCYIISHIVFTKKDILI